MNNKQSLEGATSELNSLENKTVIGCAASTSTGNQVVADNVAAEGKIEKKKKTRRGKKSTKSVPNSGNANEGKILESETVDALENLSLNHKVPDSQLEKYLNVNGIKTDKTRDARILRVQSTDTENDHSQEGEANSSTALKNKDAKKKKKSKKKVADLARGHSTDMQQTDKVDQQNSVQTQIAQKGTSRKDGNTSGKKPTKSYNLRSKASKESTTFEKYILQSEAIEGVRVKTMIRGPIRINQRNYKEAYMNAPDKGQDIMIEGMRFRNRALEGDEVVVKLNPESEWKVHGEKKQRTGKVVFIWEKVHPRVGVGFLKPMPDKNPNFALFSPRDSRVPRIQIPIKSCPENFLKEAEKYKNSMFLARIKGWEDVRHAVGEILEEIGSTGDIKAETMAILLENDIEFSPYDVDLYQYFPRSPYQIPEEELKSRADLRNECIFTIDPLTARDLDDAVSCKELDNGNLKIGVHISDVSYFLEEGTPLDQQVARKATSTYMVESVYHMLPKELCLMCSLLPGEDKLAFSVFWEITPKAEIVSHYFTRSVINSCTQLAYEHAQIMLENPDKEWNKAELPPIYGSYKPQDLSRIVNQLNSLAVIMRSNRFQSGALRIDQPKIMFSLESGSGLPSAYTVYVNKECHRLIEEFMLLANMTVATRLNSDFPQLAFLRCHPSPHLFIMEELQKTLEQRGIFIDITSAGTLQTSMWRYAGDDLHSQSRMLVLNNMCAKPMARAKYFCAKFKDLEEEFWHYALNVPLYTHFTSPIRRYADVMVHRLLCASLKYSEKPDWEPDYVQTIASNCNKQKYQAKRAGEHSIELYMALYVRLHGPMIEEAVVMDVKDLSFDVIVCNTGQVIRIYTNNMPALVKVKCRMEKKKVIAQEIEWLPTELIPYSTLQVVEVFSIVTIDLSCSAVSIKVEARLLRPPRAAFEG